MRAGDWGMARGGVGRRLGIGGVRAVGSEGGAGLGHCGWGRVCWKEVWVVRAGELDVAAREMRGRDEAEERGGCTAFMSEEGGSRECVSQGGER